MVADHQGGEDQCALTSKPFPALHGAGRQILFLIRQIGSPANNTQRLPAGARGRRHKKIKHLCEARCGSPQASLPLA